MSKWTHFCDLSSGGGEKLDWGCVVIEADESTARAYFESRFGRDPDNVTCNCCGPDYWVIEKDTPESDWSSGRLLIPHSEVVSS